MSLSTDLQPNWRGELISLRPLSLGEDMMASIKELRELISLRPLSLGEDMMTSMRYSSTRASALSPWILTAIPSSRMKAISEAYFRMMYDASLSFSRLWHEITGLSDGFFEFMLH